MLALRRPFEPVLAMTEARSVLEILEENSPLSTKALRKLADLQGRDLESTYHKALKELWSQLLIVGVGEIDDGAFPSLAIGATRWMHEEVWKEAAKHSPGSPEALERYLPRENPFL